MKLLRNLLGTALVAFCASAVAHAATPLDLGLVKINVSVPSAWKANEGTPPTYFDEANKGSIQFLATPMEMPAATYAAMHKAALDAGKTKLETGDYVKAEELAVDGFKGVLIVESAKDPTLRRMQWQAYGRGGYFNFTFASPTPAFEGYQPTFDATLKSITFAR